MQKILPPFLLIIFTFINFIASYYMNFPKYVNYPFNLVGIFIMVSGLFLSFAGQKLFAYFDTNIMTFSEPDVLVTSGVFKYTRNPMYVGFIIFLTGFSILMGASIPSIILTVVFFIITDKWYIAYEEREMIKKFGSDYEAYCKKVRRWI